VGTKSTPGDASAANQTTIIGHIDGIETLLAAIQTAVEIIDNFISGARGLVTEDNDDTNGSPEGPKNDARIDGDSNIKGMKGICNMERSGGSGSDHFILMGNDGDGTTRSADLDPPTSSDTYFFLSESGSIVPLSTEYCRIGFETTGGQDFECNEQWAMLLHVPDVVSADIVPLRTLLGVGT